MYQQQQYPPPGQQGQQVPPPQQYYVYPPLYPPAAYPQQQQPQPQQPGMMHQPQPVPQQYYQHQPQQQAPPPAPPPLPVSHPSAPQQPVASSVRRSYKTNPAVAAQATSEDGLDCCAKTLRITLLLAVTTGFVFSSLAAASCDFMTYYRPPSPSLLAGQEPQIDSTTGGGGAAALATQSPSVTPAAPATPSSPFNNANSSITIGGAAEQQESFNLVNNNNNSQPTDPITEPASIPNLSTLGPTPGPRGDEETPVVLQVVNSSPLESNEVDNNNIDLYILPDDEDERWRRLLLKRELEENTTNFEDWLPEYMEQFLLNTTIDAGIGLNRWRPDGRTTCRKYDYDDFDSFFHAARVGIAVAIIGSALACFLLVAEYTCCRFFCSRLLLVLCLVSAIIGQLMTFLMYGTPNCTDKYTQAYNCDVSTGTIYSIIATILHLFGAILGCPTPKAKPFLRVLVEKERQIKEEVDPCCWCFVGMCAKKAPKSDEQVVAQPNTNDPESGQAMAAAAVGAPPPLVPVPVYYIPQPHPFPSEVQVQLDANPPSIQTQSDSSNLPQPHVQGSTQRNTELFSIRQDAFIPGDSRSVPYMPSGGGDHDSLGGGGRSVKSQRSAYTNPEFYESDLFFDATPSVIDEEEEGEDDDVESGSGNYEEPQQKEEGEEEDESGTGNYEEPQQNGEEETEKLETLLKNRNTRSDPHMRH